MHRGQAPPAGVFGPRRNTRLWFLLGVKYPGGVAACRDGGSAPRRTCTLKSIWNADDLAKAETALAELFAGYRDTAPKLAAWLEETFPEAFAVFRLPKHHQCRMRTSTRLLDA